jgi:mono/diheme cytochrome c family protein
MLTRKLPCPSCGVGLKIAEDLPAGKKITCPKCGVGFQVPEGNGQASSPREAAVRVRKPVPEQPEEYGEQDELDEEEVEERPVIRKRRRPVVEDDDEPDDDYEERPPRRKRRKFKKKKQANRMPLILGLVIGGVLLLGGAGAIAFVLWPKEKSDSAAKNAGPSRPSRMQGGGPGGGAGPAGASDEKAPSGQEPAEPKSSESVDASDPYAAGKQVFQRRCARCHRIGESGRGGQGPDLATIGRTRDADWLKAFIRDPQSQKPNARMRPVNLSDEDLRAVAVYLASLK